jgi:predicted aldo/keto reductase-like oxidoreductase
MKYTTLPNTDIKVSKICLGTMTWGNQNTQDEGFAQMDMALDKGVNFLMSQNYILYQQQQKLMLKQNVLLVTGLQKLAIEIKSF